jgi:hypothetical protein
MKTVQPYISAYEKTYPTREAALAARSAPAAPSLAGAMGMNAPATAPPAPPVQREDPRPAVLRVALPKRAAFGQEVLRDRSPGLAPTLAQAMGVNASPATPPGHVEAQGDGKEAGSARRPSDPSFYCPTPTGTGIGLPKRDEFGKEVLRDRSLTSKLRGMSI